MTAEEFRAVIHAASDRAERAADSTGFVAIEKLRTVIGANIMFRPLLVEGIIARPKEPNGDWLILIDSETHAAPEKLLTEESHDQALPVRLRNTLAHELAHTLAFRLDEFKISITGSREEAVRRIESETENLSPLLLIPYSALQSLCSEQLTLNRLRKFRDFHTVSNEVLIRRLETLKYIDNHPLEFSPRLKNLAIGVGEKKGDTFFLASWPLFSRFSGFTPTIIHQLKNNITPSLGEAFPDVDFAANGGTRFTAAASVDAGTSQNPSGDKFDAIIQVEETTSERFLWVLHEKRP
jgi:IrrE N-terminal-like domain